MRMGETWPFSMSIKMRSFPDPARTAPPPSPCPDLATMKKLILGLLLIAFITVAWSLHQEFFGHDRMPNATRIINIACAYEAFFEDQGGTF